MKISQIIEQDKNLDKFIKQVPESKRSLLTGVNSGAFSAVLKQLLSKLNRPVVLIEENEDKAQRLASELESLLEDQVYSFPVDGIIATQAATASPDELSSRLAALNFLQKDRPGFVITTPQGLQYQLSDPKEFKHASQSLKIGKENDLQQLSQWLVQVGYRRDSLVARPGEFALRGDILDIYPLDRESPIRIEFFGDEVDTIKEFDPASQRSLKELESIEIGPALDRIYSQADFERASKLLKQDISESVADPKVVNAYFSAELDTLEQGNLPEKNNFLVDYLLAKPHSLLDYLPTDGIVVLDDWTLIKKSIADTDEQNESFISEEIKTGAMLNEQKLRQDFNKVLKKSKHPQLYFSLFQKGWDG